MIFNAEWQQKAFGDLQSCAGNPLDDLSNAQLVAMENDYESRSRAVARAYGVTHALRRVKARALARKDTPQWLIDGLDQALTRADLLIDPLIEFRGDLLQHCCPMCREIIRQKQEHKT